MMLRSFECTLFGPTGFGRALVPPHTQMSFFKPKTSEKSKNDPSKLPWTEKYRPKSLKDVGGQDSIVGVLEKTLHSDNLPHMLFYGPPGTGKTSTILALAKDLYGPELFKSRVLELNASDDRGISVVRDKIKNFSRTTVASASEEYKAKYPAPDFKIIILDEADMMTQDAQSALRRTMESYAKITRFCLVCNYVTRIIDPLASRCSKFRFKELNTQSALDRLDHICRSENLKLESDNVLTNLLELSNGDLRRSITLLQSAAGMAPNGISSNVINELNGSIPEKVIRTFIDSLKSGNQRNVEYVVRDIVMDGYSVSQLIEQLHDILMYDVSVSNIAKTKIAQAFSVADRRLTDGSDEHIELLNVATQATIALKD